MLHRAFGTLFAGYSGYPNQISKKCNCEQRLGPHAYFHYLFPSWFLTTAITFTFTRISLVKVQTALTVRRIVPVGADVFRLANLSDVDGMKELLRTSFTSPDDSDVTGTSVLSVSQEIVRFVSYSKFSKSKCALTFNKVLTNHPRVFSNALVSLSVIALTIYSVPFRVES